MTVYPPRASSAAPHAFSFALGQGWQMLALRGVLAMLFAAISFAAPAATLDALALVFAAYMLVDGVLALAAAIRAARAHRAWLWLLAEALLDLAAGVVAAIAPAVAIFGLVLLLAFWAILSGVALIVASTGMAEGRWAMALAGLVSVVWGLLCAVKPVAGAYAMALWIGAYALFFGVLMLVLAFQIRAAGRAIGVLH